MTGVLAADLALAALAVGLVGLCGFALALLFGVATIETRRRPEPQLALPPVPTRRVITGTPVELPPAAAFGTAGPVGDAVALPAAGATEQPDAAAAERLAALEEAERTIRKLMDEDPEAVVRLISAWLAQDQPGHRRGVAP